MAKSKKAEDVPDASADEFKVPATSLDPTLASLFASSSGPVKIPTKIERVTDLAVRQSKRTPTNGVNEDSSGSESSSDSLVQKPLVAEADVERPRKRRRVQTDDIEAEYFSRVAREEDREQRQRAVDEGERDDETSSSGSSASGDDDSNADISEIKEPALRHETMDTTNGATATEKLNRTVFLGNVSTSAIKSKSAKKALVTHLESVLEDSSDKQSAAKVESLRFRSTAYASGVGPKKAAYAKKELMDQTVKSTNAYAVFTTEWAAKKAASKLNGTLILDRHLRVDCIAYPSKVDNRRCVFVGNLSFVDEEMIEEKGDDGQITLRKSRAKQPADAEEGLWRTFGKVGKVESVRVVRDKDSRVGKGFGYVQFADQNGVEAALLLNDKKYPPLLPRKLRVMRSKRTNENNANGRGPKRSVQRPGRPGGYEGGRSNTHSKPQDVKRLTRTAKFIFEGHRASGTSDAKNVKTKKKRSAVKPTSRSSRRGAAFKASGGKRKRPE